MHTAWSFLYCRLINIVYIISRSSVFVMYNRIFRDPIGTDTGCCVYSGFDDHIIIMITYIDTASTLFSRRKWRYNVMILPRARNQLYTENGFYSLWKLRSVAFHVHNIYLCISIRSTAARCERCRSTDSRRMLQKERERERERAFLVSQRLNDVTLSKAASAVDNIYIYHIRSLSYVYIGI